MDNGGIKAPTSSRLFRQIAATVVGRNSTLGDLVANMMADDDSDDGKHGDDVVMDHRVLPRDEKSQYLHEEMQARLQKDYLSPTPLFDGREFNTMFRISRSRFQRIMEDIAATGNQFYLNTVDATGKPGACFEARLLLPLKTMAYGVPPHCFRDYFSMSTTLARLCCVKFALTIRNIYQDEYLRCPDVQDLKRINQLHKHVHNIDGMFGSLDCMHTYWKNCPTAWQGSYKGKEKNHRLYLKL
jgi:Plant transposon protein